MSENSINKQSFAEFTLPDLNGHEIKISDYSGKRLLIFMWASW
jgi:peroxiredoxin